jgi:ATP-dependent Clp protease ATP-binding subunit ClpC
MTALSPLLPLLLSAAADAPPPADPRIDAVVSAVVRADDPGAAVLVFAEGRLVHARGYGYSASASRSRWAASRNRRRSASSRRRSNSSASVMVGGGTGGPAHQAAAAAIRATATIKRMRRQPFSVVLLDEIEKAAPEVFDVLLGVFDEGRLTDRLGRTTSFRSAVIIRTSNLGAGSGGAVGFGKAAPPAYESEALAFFRPEFFNRIDGVVTFDPLSAETIRLVTEKELRGIAAREGFAKAGLRLTWSPEVVAHLSAKGYDRRYGARPLQRTIETLVVAPLARLLAGNPGLRDAEIRLGLADGAVAVEVAG